MADLHTYVSAAAVSLEDVEKLTRIIFGKPTKYSKHAKQTKTLSHPALVKVKTGDGIGFDAGNCVFVTNAKNNVGMLIKANYEEPFEQHEFLNVTKSNVRDIEELVPGHTYLVRDGGYTSLFIKYLGNSMFLVRFRGQCKIKKLTNDPALTFYELSVSDKK